MGALVLGTSPHLQLDEEYRVFLSLAAGQVAAAVADAQAVEAERRRAEDRAELERARAQFFTEVAVTLQRAVLGPTVLPRGFAVHYEPATGTLEVGGDWYDVVDLADGRTAWSSATSSAAGWPLPRSWVSCAAPAGRCCWRAGRRATCSSALDRFAALVPGAAVSTVFCAVIDPASAPSATAAPATCRRSWSTPRAPPAARAAAGSLPLAVADDLDGPRPTSSCRRARRAALHRRAGRAARRGPGRGHGPGRRGARRGPAPAPAELAELLTDKLLADAPDDDVAFLVYRAGAEH